MANNVVPREDRKGTLGKPSKVWKQGYVEEMRADTYNKLDGTPFYGGVHVLERGKHYNNGDLAFSNSLPSWAYLVCVGAGTTDATREPNLSTVVEDSLFGDGTVTFQVQRYNKRQQVTPSPDVMMIMPPAHYSRDRRWESTTGTSVSSPTRLWVNVGDGGYILTGVQTLDLNNHAHWDSKATPRQASTEYQLDECVYPPDGSNGRIYRCIVAGTTPRVAVPTSWPTTIGDIVVDGDVEWQCDIDPTVAADRAGRDFYIYACEPESGNVPVLLLSPNSTIANRYSVQTSRKIGGFHCECADIGVISGHPLSGLMAGDVIPTSVWDLNHRPKSESEGMYYDEGTGIWVDIYLPSWDGNKLVSRYGAEIADGESSKKFHGEIFAEEAGRVGKRLLSRDEFIVIAKGSNETTVIAGSADPVTTGGHQDTAGRRMVSNGGGEDMCGALWQWTRDIHGQGNGSSASNSYYLSTASANTQTVSKEGIHHLQGSTGWQEDGRGVSNIACGETIGQYGKSYGALARFLVGGVWVDSVRAGSRSVSGARLSSHRRADFSGRLASEQRVANN